MEIILARPSSWNKVNQTQFAHFFVENVYNFNYFIKNFFFVYLYGNLQFYYYMIVF